MLRAVPQLECFEKTRRSLRCLGYDKALPPLPPAGVRLSVAFRGVSLYIERT